MQLNLRWNPIDWNKLNMASQLENKGLVDDNLYAMGGGLLQRFLQLMESKMADTVPWSHTWLPLLDKEFGSVRFLLNERLNVPYIATDSRVGSTSMSLREP